MKSIYLVFLMFLFVILIGLAGRYLFQLWESEAVLVLEDLLDQEADSRLKVATSSPERHQVTYTVDGRTRYADLYRPGQGVAAGIVLVPGLAPDGKEDPRLMALANTLARVRFMVLVPELMNFRSYQVRASNIQEVADACRYLSTQPELAKDSRVGIGAFSFAVGPAVLAATREDIREQVSFVLAVGGYYDLRRLVAFFTTGTMPTRGTETQRWQGPSPEPYSKWVFTMSNVDLLEDPGDRHALKTLAQDKLHGRRDPNVTDEVLPNLGPEGQALYQLLINKDPDRVPALVAQLPLPIQKDISALNPAEHDLSTLKAHLILLHGRKDNIIPYLESLALAEAVLPGQARMFLIDGLAHVDVRPTLWDLPQLVRVIEALLDERTVSPE